MINRFQEPTSISLQPFLKRRFSVTIYRRLHALLPSRITITNDNRQAMTQAIQYSPIWRRFAAIIYDTLLIAAVSMGYGAIGVALSQWLSGAESVGTTSPLHLLFQLGWLVVVVGFFCFFWMKAGQTLGMRAWRLKIVKEETVDTPSLQQCLGRCVLAPIGLTSFFIGLLRNDKQCIHDIFTKTQVILLPKGS